MYNIKGNLKTNVSFPFSVYGGVDHTQRFVSAFDNSFIEVGGLYLIIARAKENGEINAFGPNTVLPLTRGGEPDISLLSTASIEEVYGDVIDIYKEAVAKNDDEFAPEKRYKSKYEAEVTASVKKNYKRDCFFAVPSVFLGFQRVSTLNSQLSTLS